MSQLALVDVEKDNSNEAYKLRLPIYSYQMGSIFPDADATKRLSPFPIASIQQLKVRNKLFSIFLIQSLDGGCIARTSTSTFSASGQGDTEEEALQDIRSAIELLMEEESNPSGDVSWPENYR